MDPTEPIPPPPDGDHQRGVADQSAVAGTDQSPRRAFEGSDQLPRLVFHSLSSAMCAVVPVPFLDDYLVKLTRRRMTRELAGQRGLELGSEDVAVLSGTEPKQLGWGCFVGLLVSLGFRVVVKVLRRIFRTILFWLLVKDAADAASKTFHEGYLIDGMLRRSPSGDPRKSPVQAMRHQIEAVLDQIDIRSLTGGFRVALRGTRSAMSSGARRLSHLVGLRREADGGAQRLEDEITDTIPSSWVEQATAMLQREGDYLHRLDELLAEQVYLAQRRAHPPAPPAPPSESSPADEDHEDKKPADTILS